MFSLRPHLLLLVPSIVLCACSGAPPTPDTAEVAQPLRFDIETCDQKRIPIACLYAGRAFLLGDGVPRDGARGRAALEVACEAGYRRGCQYLGDGARKSDEPVEARAGTAGEQIDAEVISAEIAPQGADPVLLRAALADHS